MANEIQVQPTLLKSTPAVIEFNFQELREKYAQMLKDYDVVVTVDTVKSSKKLMAELNKEKALIADAFKAAKKEVVAPVTEAEKNVKEIIATIEESRTKITEQVSKFESETKEKALEKLIEEQKSLWESEGVMPEFQRSDVSSIVTLNALTSKGALSSEAFRKLEALVKDDKARQVQTEFRLSQLENECYKNGLSVPLGRGHVESFLFASTDEYNERLGGLIAQELERHRQVEEATIRKQREIETQHARELQEQEAKLRAEQESKIIERNPEPQPIEETQSEQPADDLREYRKQVNNEILKSLIGLGVDVETSKKIIIAAVSGELGKLTVNY